MEYTEQEKRTLKEQFADMLEIGQTQLQTVVAFIGKDYQLYRRGFVVRVFPFEERVDL